VVGQIAEQADILSRKIAVGPGAPGSAAGQAPPATLAGPVTDAALLGLVVDAVADGVTVQRLDGRLVLANLAGARLAGCETAEELIASASGSLRDRFELFGEDRQSLGWADLPGAQVLLGSPRTTRVVGFRNRETGVERWSSVTSTPIRDADGKVAFAVNAFHDITTAKLAEEDLRRQQSEAQELLAGRLGDEVRLAELVTAERARSAELNAIIGAIGEGIIVVDGAGTVSLANRTAEQLLGPTEALAADGPLDRLALPAGMDLPALVAHGPLHARLHGQDGRWLEVAAYPVDGPDRIPGATILILRDVTDAREREEARDAFIGVLSHELRTPLTVISGALQMLRRTAVDSDEGQLVESAIRRVAELEFLVEGLELVATGPSLDGGAAHPRPAIITASERIGIHPDTAGVLDEAWTGVSHRYLSRVAFELLSNAARHGAPPIEVRTSRRDDRAGLTVCDGGGWAPAATDFSAFFQEDMSSTRDRSGFGLGLFLAARLCQACQGDLSIRVEGGVTVAEATFRLH